MLLLKLYKTFFCIFFVIGLAPFITENEMTEPSVQRTAIKLFFCKLVPIINLLFSLSHFSFLLIILDGTLDGKIHVILFYGYFILNISSNIVSNIICFFYQSEYLDIIRRIDKIEQSFMNKFSKEINLKKSYTSFKWKTVIIYSILVGATLSSYTFDGWQLSEKFVLRSVVTMLETICTMGSLHPMLFIALIRMFIREMSEALKSSKKSFRMASSILSEELKKIKIIHFEIYNLVTKINKYFGWKLLFLQVKYFVDITYNLYWIFIETQELGWRSVTHIGIDKVDLLRRIADCIKKIFQFQNRSSR